MQLIIDAVCDRGLVPTTNEDLVIVGNDVLRDGAKHYEFDFSTYDHPKFLIAVADGLGGHGHGAESSRMVLNGMSAELYKLPPGLSKQALMDRIQLAANLVNASLVHRNGPDDTLPGHASTFLGLLFYDKRAMLLHTGDCRAYHISGQRFARLSRDHSLASLMRDESNLKTALANAFGRKRGFFMEITDIAPKLNDDDLVCLCTDGLHGPLSDADIAALATQSDPQKALLQAAIEKGGLDNISLIVARYLRY